MPKKKKVKKEKIVAPVIEPDVITGKLAKDEFGTQTAKITEE